VKQLLRANRVAELLGVSRTTVWRLSRNPDAGFPPPIKLSRNVVAYDSEALDRWISDRAVGTGAEDADQEGRNQ
jgi:predicted DNA-binding transcriptional regulator AlpA